MGGGSLQLARQGKARQGKCHVNVAACGRAGRLRKRLDRRGVRVMLRSAAPKTPFRGRGAASTPGREDLPRLPTCFNRKQLFNK